MENMAPRDGAILPSANSKDIPAMLPGPSRLFRIIGIASPLRSLFCRHLSLYAPLALQTRFRLGIRSHHPTFSTSTVSRADSQSSSSSPAVTSHEQHATGTESEPRLSLTFTCTASDCSRHRSTHTFTRRAYERGIVLVQCPGCKNRHLIADHLGWFKESTSEGRLRTVEDILRARGEDVRRGRLGAEGDIEFYE